MTEVFYPLRHFSAFHIGTRDNRPVRELSKAVPGLQLLQYLPLAVSLEASTTGLNKPISGTSNWDYSLPQDVALYVAGEFTKHAGGFIQTTYDIQSDHFSWDMTDIRYARSTTLGKNSLTYGIDLNNNPTLEDLWNDVPAWGFPWVDSPSAPMPAAATLIDGTLMGDVAGIGAYAMYDNHLYGTALVYRSAQPGGLAPPGCRACDHGETLPNLSFTFVKSNVSQKTE